MVESVADRMLCPTAAGFPEIPADSAQMFHGTLTPLYCTEQNMPSSAAEAMQQNDVDLYLKINK